MLIETAQEVHGRAGLFKKKGEFPAPLEHGYPISSEAVRCYKSGKSFLYRPLPCRWASLANWVRVALVPAARLSPPLARTGH